MYTTKEALKSPIWKTVIIKDFIPKKKLDMYKLSIFLHSITIHWFIISDSKNYL